MNKYKETHHTWNQISKQYEDKFMNFDLYNHTYDFFLELLAGKTKLLEIGCGPGNVTKYFLSQKPQLNILGTDIAPKMVERAQKNNPTARFMLLDARNLGVITEKFDALFGGFCIPYLSPSDVSAMIETSTSIVNKEGLLYLSFVDGKPIQSGFIEGSVGGRMYFHYHSKESLTKELEYRGYEILKTFVLNYQKNKEETEAHVVIIAKKK